MKILHMADVHLDSKLSRYFDNEKARERRNEILNTFTAAVEYAANEGVEAVIIAGDLFDVRNITATARDSVSDSIEQHPEITFYYLRGNHDADSFVQNMIEKRGGLPANLKMFSDTWTSYRQEASDGVTVVITGAEMNADNNSRLVSSLVLNQDDFNIVVLHGQEVELASKKDAEVIPLRDYKNKGIDYMALGHIHEPKIEQLDARGRYSYSGCLEGRGYDEIGQHGFNILDIKSEGGKATYEVHFTPFAKRIIHRIAMDLNEAGMDVITSQAIVRHIQKAAAEAGVEAKDMLRVELVGKIDSDAEIDVEYIRKSLENDFYHIKVVDLTKPSVSFEDFMLDKSLRGEFVRLIKEKAEQGELSEDEAAVIAQLGIDVLAGEGITL